MKLSKTIHRSWLKVYFIFLNSHRNLYIQQSILFLNNIFKKITCAFIYLASRVYV